MVTREEMVNRLVKDARLRVGREGGIMPQKEVWDLRDRLRKWDIGLLTAAFEIREG